MNCDLHSHSIYSDGELSPKQVVREAKKINLKCISLTDHNSVSGVKEAISEGNKLNVEVIPGVEIYSDCSEILGYFIDINNKELKELLKKIQKKDDDGGKKVIKLFKKMGHEINYGDVKRKFGYPVMKINCIRYLTNKKGLNRKKSREFLDSLRKETYYPGGKAYFTSKTEKAEKVIKIILRAGGVPVLAHPWFQKNYEKRIPNLAKAGLKGIEYGGPTGSWAHKVKANKKKIDKLAKQYNLVKTGGSDFHGKWRNPLGMYGCDYSIVEKLKELRN